MRKRRTLKASLFIGPSLIIISMFCIVLLVFNIFVSNRISQIASEHIDSMFSTFSLFNEKEENWQFTENESGYGLTTAYVVLNESEEAIDPCPPFLSTEEQSMTAYITAYYQQNRSALHEGNQLSFTREGRTYYIQLRTYYGYYDGYALFQDQKDIWNHQYQILVYTDATPLIEFGNTVDRILLALMACALSLSLLALLIRSKKLDSAFRSLDAYISLAGNRQRLPDDITFAYDEFYDVAKTIRVMTEMINQAENAQMRFFSNASHELKTPLMAIQGYAEGLQSGAVKDREKGIAVIIRETQKMALLINDILLLSRMDAVNTPIRQETFDLRELVLYCAGTIETTAMQSNIVLHLDVDETPIPYNGDESAMERAVLNILSNALRYAKSAIDIKCKHETAETVISITDDGPGIPSENLPHIFERFYKGYNGNFGIGLSITQEVIHQHHGLIAVDSKPGRTMFRISLPDRCAAA